MREGPGGLTLRVERRKGQKAILDSPMVEESEWSPPLKSTRTGVRCAGLRMVELNRRIV